MNEILKIYDYSYLVVSIGSILYILTMLLIKGFFSNVKDLKDEQ